VTLTAPFPWFGGKRRVASLVWERFGDVAHYVEPFFGSGAVLLGAPKPAKVETVNDLDGFVANFWRAVQWDPDGVTKHADWPVNEADLHARHAWLIGQRGALTERLMADPRYFNAEIAGWWVWGLSQWIAGGWCPHDKRPAKTRPHLGYNRGVLGNSASSIADLAARLRHVRVLCGSWERAIPKDGILSNLGTPQGILLDPPYALDLRDDGCYATDAPDVARDCGAWCREHGNDPRLRIALCGYDGEHDMPGWTAVQWSAHGGMAHIGNGRGRENAKRETIWFSPHCLQARQASLF
jgi:DNA adenine methylase